MSAKSKKRYTNVRKVLNAVTVDRMISINPKVYYHVETTTKQYYEACQTNDLPLNDDLLIPLRVYLDPGVFLDTETWAINLRRFLRPEQVSFVMAAYNKDQQGKGAVTPTQPVLPSGAKNYYF